MGVEEFASISELLRLLSPPFQSKVNVVSMLSYLEMEAGSLPS